MNGWNDEASFPVADEVRVSEWVDEIGRAYTRGERVLWFVPSDARVTPFVEPPSLDALRLSYVERASQLLRGRPESASILSRIHREFDEYARSSKRGLSHRLRVLGADVLARVLSSRAENRGLRVGIERNPDEGSGAGSSPSGEAEFLVRLVAR